MRKIIAVNSQQDIPQHYQNTAIEKLLLYQNTDLPFENYDSAQLLIGMCMDNRKHLHIPENFAYIIRSGGANLRNSEFKVSYAIAIGGIRSIALIAHNNCGMVNLHNRKQQFIDGLVENAGWEALYAEEHYNTYAPLFEIGNEIDFVITEANRLRNRYPNITVAPLYYTLETNMLALLQEK